MARAYTGQELDDTGLRNSGARDYDPTLGRFVSPDTLIPVSDNRYRWVDMEHTRDLLGYWPQDGA